MFFRKSMNRGRAARRRLTVEQLESRDLLSAPPVVPADGGGTLYVSTFGDSAIERVNPAGQVSPFVTSGLSGPIEILFGPHRDLFVANFGQTFGSGTSIGRITPSGQVSTFASGLTAPLGLAFDSAGFLYTSSPVTNTISKIAPDGTVTPFVTSGLAGPLGLAFDNDGNLYTTNFFAGTVGKITPTGTVTTLASGFAQPTDVMFDGQATLYVDSGSSTISKVSLSGTVTPFVSAGLSTPAGMVFGSHGTLYVADETNGTISEVTPDGVVSTFATGLNVPQGLAFFPDGTPTSGQSRSMSASSSLGAASRHSGASALVGIPFGTNVAGWVWFVDSTARHGAATAMPGNHQVEQRRIYDMTFALLAIKEQTSALDTSHFGHTRARR